MPTVPESEKVWINHKRLRLLALAAGVSLRHVERRLGLKPGNLWQPIRRGWIRRRVAKRIARELGCKPSDFEVHHAN